MLFFWIYYSLKNHKYIKQQNTYKNIWFLCRNITSHSCLKVYHKDPAQAFNHNARANNGEIRVSDKSVTADPLNCPIIITLHVQLKNH